MESGKAAGEWAAERGLFAALEPQMPRQIALVLETTAASTRKRLLWKVFYNIIQKKKVLFKINHP